jgi:hypothetical protein
VKIDIAAPKALPGFAAVPFAAVMGGFNRIALGIALLFIAFAVGTSILMQATADFIATVRETRLPTLPPRSAGQDGVDPRA